MEVVPMHKAKSTLSQLVKRAAQGETIYIGGYGKAEAVLVSAEKYRPKKIFGLLKGQLDIPDDFDAPLPDDILSAFYDGKI